MAIIGVEGKELEAILGMVPIEQELEKLYMSIAGERKKKGTKFIECVSFCTFYYYYLIYFSPNFRGKCYYPLP